MARKKILAICLVLSLITGILMATVSCDLPGIDFFGNNDGTVINSDGERFPSRALNSTAIISELPDGEQLPVVGNRETLLRLLKDRGALYDNSYRVMNEDSGIPVPTVAFDSDFALTAPEAEMQEFVPSHGGSDSNTPYSQTNEQVAGVSEGDIVKTDGRYLYTMSQHDNTLRIIRAEADELEVVSTISIEGVWGAEFYIIDDDRLAIIGGEHVTIQPLPGLDDQPASRIMPDVYGWYGNSFTVLIIFDISDRDAPVELRRVSMEGWSISTRVIGGIVYLVTTKYVWGIPLDHADSPYILPYSRDTDGGGEYEPISFDRIHYVPGTNDTSYMLIGAIDVYDDAAFEPKAYLGAGSNLYMSRNAMYITQFRWEESHSTGNDDTTDIWMPGRYKTDIMRFAVNGTDVTYTGKGSVDGSPINQYSMDEFNGFFRIATTDWTEGTYVTVLNTSDMQTVGRTEPLAPGEQMHSMRFMGDMGYVVTFLNVDPLFTIDLSDPYNPKMLGELKIPGFSQYLHPVGDGLLLGIGRDTQEIYVRDENGVETVIGFNDTGMRVTLFDVKNPFNPREIDVLTLGEGWTEVSHNPRAFMRDSIRNLYGFTTESWNSNGNGMNECSAVILRVENGRLTIAKTLRPDSYVQSYGSRLCFIGDTLYFVHNQGIIVYDYDSFERLGSISF